MDLPIRNGGSFHSYVKLPEGTPVAGHFFTFFPQKDDPWSISHEVGRVQLTHWMQAERTGTMMWWCEANMEVMLCIRVFILNHGKILMKIDENWWHIWKTLGHDMTWWKDLPRKFAGAPFHLATFAFGPYHLIASVGAFELGMIFVAPFAGSFGWISWKVPPSH